LSDRKRQRSMIISFTLLGTPVLDPRQIHYDMHQE